METKEKLISYKHTYAVILQLKESLLRIVRSIDIVSQLLFILFYVYCLVKKIDSLPWVITYSILIGISSLFLLFYIFTFRSKNKFVKRLRSFVRRITKYSKFLIRGAIVGYNIHVICTTQVTELYVILTILSLVLLILQIIFDIMIWFTNRYIDLLIESIKWDYEESLAVQKVVSMFKDKDDNPSIGKRIVGAVASKWLHSKTNNDDIVDVISSEQQDRRDKIQDIEDKFLNK